MSSATIPPPAATVLGTRVWGLTLEAFLDLAFARIRNGVRTLFTTANAHSLVVARGHPGLAAHYRDADVVLPDGFLAAWGARRCGGDVPARVAGPDFFEAFLARAAREGVSVFFLGTTDATLARIVERSGERFPGLRVAGTLSPPFGEFDDESNQRLVAAVNAARPDALFVAMTAPKQELWLSRNFAQLEVNFAIGVGAAFDFLAGNKRRPPPFVGQRGGEWLFRLLSEPRRLWRRELDGGVFLWMLAKDRMGRRRRERTAGCGPP